MINNDIVCMIPARIGSERLKRKNLILVNNKPIISYVIEVAKQTNKFKSIYLNSDHRIFKRISKENSIDFYLRKKKYATSNTKSDSVVYDFIQNINCKYIVWLNPIAPLQTAEEVSKIIEYFLKNKLNSLITVYPKKVHSLYKNKPLNFSLNQKFSKTQDLVPINEMVYSVMMWKSQSFIKQMKKKNYAILHGKVGYFPVNYKSSILLKNIDDLRVIRSYLTKEKKDKIKYYKI